MPEGVEARRSVQMATPWIQETANYYSIETGRDEYHVGGWICFEGKNIKAEHLVSGRGGRTKECPECIKHAKH
jgi:hypothetical protein